ncbi:uncharacterized protein AMSG_02648 [Thecamonas trahens ATCC 50062]|uniref:Uncharacterized protein n=1 Tax=Thecamonas trahens ATCC 50062 TaxID=461836 RepID=A0A0L0D616_THETB|nr:hypothetical protein AMSG_02648 [Thecamonas trahens ATCC 50062]KNC47625.1 hypothetical protein AMSG_02648 [Thecamonas trahens ATCC 50062]|eukprot:XP_013759547.1 hypothetical protein AMSG_02648 [Thecamonas trahens ATCC 50062]
MASPDPYHDLTKYSLEEAFALTGDRPGLVAKLVPGQRDAFYYTGLLLADGVAAGDTPLNELAAHLASSKSSFDSTREWRELNTRFKLLAYDAATSEVEEDPFLEFLISEYDLSFQTPRLEPAKSAASTAEPGPAPSSQTRHESDSAVPPVDRNALYADAYRSSGVSGFRPAAYPWLLNKLASAATKDEYRHLKEVLDALPHARLPGTLPALLHHMASDKYGGIYSAYRQLTAKFTLAQLDELLEAKPALRDDATFVDGYLAKLHPGADVDMQYELSIGSHACTEYISKCLEFVRTLAPVFNPYRHTLLYHSLVIGLAAGHGMSELEDCLLELLAIPSSVSFADPDWVRPFRSDGARAGYVSSSSSSVPSVPAPSSTDVTSLIERLLRGALSETRRIQPYAKYVRSTTLERWLAEEQLFASGSADPTNSVLSASTIRSLRDRVDLEFGPSNAAYFAPNDHVTLDVVVKNVPKLLVRVYEVNTAAVYRDSLSQVSEHLSVEGLVPNNEYEHKYDAPPMVRAQHTLPLPCIGMARGVFVVELIGGGRSLRAVIRVGHLYALSHPAPTGHVLRVYDETSALCPDAQLTLDGHQYVANAHGEILVPYTSSPGRRTVVLTSDGFADLYTFDHAGENYSFAAAFYLDREQLLSKHTAVALVRAQLSLNGMELPLARLSHLVLTITTTDIDGVVSTSTIDDFELSDLVESTYGFVVPDKTVAVALELTGSVRSRATESDVQLRASQSFQLNKIDLTAAMDDVFLRRTSSGYSLVVVDKSGRRVANAPLSINLAHIDVSRSTSCLTRFTDASGAVHLGHLPNVSAIRARNCSWTLQRASGSMPRLLHGIEGEELRFPYHGQVPRADDDYAVSCTSRNAVGAVVDDVSTAVAVSPGLVRVSGLTAGDYVLFVPNAAGGFDQLTLRVAAASTVVTFSHTDPVRHRIFVSPGRILEQVASSEPMAVTDVTASSDELTVQLAHASGATRVHVVCSHFVPNYNPAELLGPSAFFRQMSDTPRPLSRVSSAYHAARALSAEAQYILNRQFAAKHPGNMLKRPSLLLALNDRPGNVDDVRRFTPSSGSLRDQMGMMMCEDEDEMECSMMAPSMARSMSKCRKKKKREGRGPVAGSVAEARSLRRRELSADETGSILSDPYRHNIEFLLHGSDCMFNLRPDTDGRVVVPLDQISPGNTVVSVVVVDGDAHAARQFALPESSVTYNDMRLLKPLDAERHFAEVRAIDVMPTGGLFDVADKRTTESMAYDTVGKVFSLFSTLLGGSADFEAFRFVTTWGSMDREAKLAKYAEFASHELNVFVAFKDRTFFADVVAPFLANKKVKTFVDDYLLGADLSKWTVARKFERLNIVEKILLGGASGDAAILRHVLDQADLLPADRATFYALHKVALKAKLESAGDLPNAAGDVPTLGGGGGGSGGGGMPRGGYDDAPTRRYYAPLPGTKEYGENNYHRVPIELIDERLVQISKFWGAYGAHVMEQLEARQSGAAGEPAPYTPAFLSEHFVHAASSPTEALLALAVLDLPFESNEHTVELEGASRSRLMAASPVIMVHKQVCETDEGEAPILVCQNFFDPNDRYAEVDNERVDKFVSDEFVINKVYGCQVAVTNISTARQKVDILEQIPAGAVPLCGGFFTRSHYIELNPYATVTDEFQFYFPAAGAAAHFPIHVAQNEVTVASAARVTLNVVDVASVHDTLSWSYVAAHGTIDEVVAFLDSHNPLRFQILDIEDRLGHKEWWLKIMKLLRAHKAYVHRVWQYGLKHHDRRAVAEWLYHNDGFIDRLGASCVLSILPLDVESEVRYQHLEYEPVVNPRAHPLPGVSQSTAPAMVKHQYEALLGSLKYSSTFRTDDLLALTYYLLLLDRVDEAAAFFARIDRTADVSEGGLANELQVDYFAAYLDIFFGAETGYATARAIAAKYVAYPVKRWREMFMDVLRQLSELDDPSSASAALSTLSLAGSEAAASREEQMAALAATEPAFDFTIEGTTGVVSYQNVARVTVNYYLMDIELLFSSSPFVAASSKNVLKPNEVEEHATTEVRNGTLRFDIASSFAKANVLIEVVAGSVVRSASYFAQSFAAHLIENYGQLRVALPANAGSGPIKNAYVKVYARLHSGRDTFWRDGYTDFRGKFDYATVSGGDISSVARFAILIITPDHGCVVKEAAPPRT